MSSASNIQLMEKIERTTSKSFLFSFVQIVTYFMKYERLRIPCATRFNRVFSAQHQNHNWFQLNEITITSGMHTFSSSCAFESLSLMLDRHWIVWGVCVCVWVERAFSSIKRFGIHRVLYQPVCSVYSTTVECTHWTEMYAYSLNNKFNDFHFVRFLFWNFHR